MRMTLVNCSINVIEKYFGNELVRHCPLMLPSQPVGQIGPTPTARYRLLPPKQKSQTLFFP